MSADEKKPPRTPIHRDYPSVGRKTPVGGIPALPPLIIRETSSAERHDPTPPPAPNTITNEDLAVQISNVKKEQTVFQGSTTIRLATLETNVRALDTKVDTKFETQAEKIDNVKDLLIEQLQQKQTVTMDILRGHMEVGKQAQISEVKVREHEEIAEIDDKTNQKKTRRERNLKILDISSKVIGLLATGGVLGALLHAHC